MSETQEIKNYSVGFLPEGHTLVLYRPLGTLSLMNYNVGQSKLVAQQQFTRSELLLLIPLLELHPNYCPLEVLLASFNANNLTEKAVAFARRRLYEAKELGKWDDELRPVRNVLSRTRLKMFDLGIDIKSVLETGYVLFPKSSRTSWTEM